ncbi:MAG: sulfotransferase [Phycisphaeraceae bacterium]|nr:MAG: sulfotransferase [Phycisphaeraceae bacterium]
MKPNYLVIGAQKCATSSLCDLLGRHPDIFMTKPKELYFFSHDHIWRKGWNWYEQYFQAAEGMAAAGEGSASYSMQATHPDAAPRIAEHLPDAKLFYIVRNPLDRILSNWIHLRSRGGRERLPFNDAVRTNPVYLDTSSYRRQIDVYRRWWPDDRIMVLFFEDFTADQPGTMRRCFEFLGVDPDREALPESLVKNASTGSREDTPILKALRRIPNFSTIRKRVPEPVRKPFRTMLKKPTEKPRWDEQTRAWTVERLREDSHAFLERYGKPHDYWGF